MYRNMPLYSIPKIVSNFSFQNAPENLAQVFMWDECYLVGVRMTTKCSEKEANMIQQRLKNDSRMPLNATGMTQNAAKMTQNATHLHFILRLPNLGFPVGVVNLKPNRETWRSLKNFIIVLYRIFKVKIKKSKFSRPQFYRFKIYHQSIDQMHHRTTRAWNSQKIVFKIF